MKKLFLMAITAMFCASVIATETQTQTTTETNSEYAAGDSDWEFVKNVNLVGITQMGQTFSTTYADGELYHQSGTGYQWKVVKGSKWGYVGNNNLKNRVNDDDPRRNYDWTVNIGGINYYFNM